LATRLVVVVAALLGPLGAASTAHADPADDAFLGMLRSDGITHDSPQAAIEAGRKVCEYLGQGKTLEQVVYEVVFSSHLPAYDSGYLSARALVPIARSTRRRPAPHKIQTATSTENASDRKTFRQCHRCSRRRRWVGSTCCR
jgi:hypothetical protein